MSGGRILGIDIGTKRIGLAVSDPDQTVATPLATLTRRLGKRFPMKQLKEHLDRLKPVGIVVGLPLTEEGGDDAWTAEVRSTAARIAEQSGLPVDLWDERMTTARVRATIGEMGGGTRGRKEEVDRLAATVLLQTFLDSRR
jgi:putative Holliday junction resolvase